MIKFELIVRVLEERNETTFEKQNIGESLSLIGERALHLQCGQGRVNLFTVAELESMSGEYSVSASVPFHTVNRVECNGKMVQGGDANTMLHLGTQLWQAGAARCVIDVYVEGLRTPPVISR